MHLHKRRIPKPAVCLSLLLPVAFFLVVYWNGLKNWFEQDDFAWLGLHAQVYDLPSLLNAMFAPMAQGTIRPWSERGFFLLFYKLFGANAVPYHIAVFATHAANLVLLNLILWKLTASRVTATLAPIFWTANAALLTPLCWVSDYNQIQCAFFLLLAFLLYLHGHYWMQVGVFVLGFGALELNIVYPALVASYVLLCAPSKRNLIRTLPLFAISVLYYAFHFSVAPRQVSGVYVLHFDAKVFQTVWNYWTWTFEPLNAVSWPFAVWLFTASGIGFVACQYKQGKKLPLFFLLWFFITLGPILPLREHISDYYLAIPVLGIGTLLALAITQTNIPLRVTAAAVGLFFLLIHIPVARFGTRWYLGHTRPVRSLVWGVQRARHLHPKQTILLTGLSDDLYLDSIAHSVFRALEIPDVYLAPEAAQQVARLDSQNPDALNYVLSAGPVIHAFQKEILQVYTPAGDRLRNVTSAYEKSVGERYGWNPEKNVPQRVDAGAPLLAYLLGSTWYPPVGNFRWMPSRASFRIGVPRIGNAKLILTGFCPLEQTKSGPLTLEVLVGGARLAEAKISKPETSFSRTFVLPPDLVSRASAAGASVPGDFIEVTLVVDRTIEQPAGSPPLGLAFGTFEIR